MGLIEDLDKCMSLVNSMQPHEKYIIVCHPITADQIIRTGILPDYITLLESPYCDYDKVHLIRVNSRLQLIDREDERQMEVLETIVEESDIPDSCIECLYVFEDKKKYGKTVCCSKDRRHRDVTHVSRGTRALFCPLKCRKKVK